VNLARSVCTAILVAPWWIGCAASRQYTLQAMDTPDTDVEFQRGVAIAGSYSAKSAAWSSGADYNGDRSFRVSLAVLNASKAKIDFSEARDVYAWYAADGDLENRVELITLPGEEVIDQAHRRARRAVVLSSVATALNGETDPVARQLQAARAEQRHAAMVGHLKDSLLSLEQGLLRRTTLKPDGIVGGSVHVQAPSGVKIFPVCDSRDLLLVEVVVNEDLHRFQFEGIQCYSVRL
jgi:hypothetical protein